MSKGNQEMVEVKSSKVFNEWSSKRALAYIFLSGGIEITEITSLERKYQTWPAKEASLPK